MVAITKKVEQKTDLYYIKSETEDIRVHSQTSKRFPEAGLATRKRHICLVKTMSRCSAAQKVFHDGAPDGFGVSHLDVRNLDTFNNWNMLLSVCTAK